MIESVSEESRFTSAEQRREHQQLSLTHPFPEIPAFIHCRYCSYLSHARRGIGNDWCLIPDALCEDVDSLVGVVCDVAAVQHYPEVMIKVLQSVEARDILNSEFHRAASLDIIAEHACGIALIGKSIDVKRSILITERCIHIIYAHSKTALTQSVFCQCGIIWSLDVTVMEDDTAEHADDIDNREHRRSPPVTILLSVFLQVVLWNIHNRLTKLRIPGSIVVRHIVAATVLRRAVAVAYKDIVRTVECRCSGTGSTEYRNLIVPAS